MDPGRCPCGPRAEASGPLQTGVGRRGEAVCEGLGGEAAWAEGGREGLEGEQLDSWLMRLSPRPETQQTCFEPRWVPCWEAAREPWGWGQGSVLADICSSCAPDSATV